MLQYGVTIFNLFIIFPSVQAGDISVGIFLALAQAMWSFVGNLQYEIINIIKNYTNFLRFEKDYKIFAEIPEDIINDKVCQKDSFNVIELKNIWFRYSEDAQYVLQGINLKIHYGEKIGFVGENGSGKSTLIKIISGILIPTKGEILIDGISIINDTRYLLRNFMSVIFQDYGRYDLTLQETIALGKLDDINNKRKMMEIISALQKDREFFEIFQNAMETKLGKTRWNGQELSGGQWQILMLVRAIFADREILILDEPTASLDPVAEVNLYNYIYRSEDMQTVFLVTHRLGAIVNAQKIYLLSEGSVMEEGTHTELMAAGGKYKAMFETQKQYFNGGSYLEDTFDFYSRRFTVDSSGYCQNLFGKKVCKF